MPVLQVCVCVCICACVTLKSVVSMLEQAVVCVAKLEAGVPVLQVHVCACLCSFMFHLNLECSRCVCVFAYVRMCAP